MSKFVRSNKTGSARARFFRPTHNNICLTVKPLYLPVKYKHTQKKLKSSTKLIETKVHTTDKYDNEVRCSAAHSKVVWPTQFELYTVAAD